MKPRALYLLLLVLFSLLDSPLQAQQKGGLRTDSLPLFDAARKRLVPVLAYSPEHRGKLKPAILSHGYGGHNDAYGFIAWFLAAHGYYVASIQHEIPGDEPIPARGIPYVVRMPHWQRGAQNILFVIEELKKKEPGLDYKNLLLIGHSNGGDMSMLFSQEHPDLVSTVISLDNRRMPFPRSQRPRVFSIRSSDQPADSGVIPSPEEQARYQMKVVKLPATMHNDMWDGGTEAQKAEIIGYLADFLGIPI